jgi:hypothetical protein
MRVLDVDYYKHALISWQIKIGEIDWKPPIHNKPEFYGLTEKEAINSRIRYLRANFNALTQKFNAIKGEYLRGEREFAFITFNGLQERIDKLSKAISFNRARLKGKVVNQPFDLEAIKRVPMNTICKINQNGFFQTNPFRTEKEPSNSLFWYRDKNRYMDFATSQGGDVIDLAMAINQCNFREACKYLLTI